MVQLLKKKQMFQAHYLLVANLGSNFSTLLLDKSAEMMAVKNYICEVSDCTKGFRLIVHFIQVIATKAGCLDRHPIERAFESGLKVSQCSN